MFRILCYLLLPFTISANLLQPFSGTLFTRHIEFPNGRDENRYYLSETEQRLLFNLTPIQETGPIHGTGYLHPSNHSIQVNTFYFPEALREYNYEPLLPPENLKILIFILNLCNRRVTNDTTLYQRFIFRNTQKNLADYYKSCSLDRMNVWENESRLLFPVDVPCNVSLGTTCEDRDFVGWSQYAEGEAVRRGITLSRYKYRAFIIPFGTTCNWLGLADVGCMSWCRSWVKGGVEGFSLQALFHELGHNHGLRHAGTPPDNEYGDFTAAMGSCCGIRCHNVAQGYALGWYDPLPLNLNRSSTLVELPAMLTQSTNHLRINTYFISFRTRIGYDNDLSAANQIHIHNYSGTPSNRYYRSWLLALLTVNQTWSEKTQGWNIRFLNFTATKALLQINNTKIVGCGVCGDGVCDPSAGETCFNCPVDCRERTTAAGVYFCCGVTHTCHYFRCNTTRYICNYECGPAPPETVRKIIL